jgi:hypothetical protein
MRARYRPRRPEARRYDESHIFTLINLKWRKFGKDPETWREFWAFAQGQLGRPVRRLEDLTTAEIDLITARLRELPEHTPAGQGAIQW